MDSKLPKPRLMDQIEDYTTLSRAVVFLAQRSVLPEFCFLCCLCTFSILFIRLCIPWENTSKFPDPLRFSLLRVFFPSKFNSCLFSKVWKLSTLRDFPKALSVHFDLPLAYGGVRDAQQWHQTARTRRPRYIQILRMETRYYLCC